MPFIYINRAGPTFAMAAYPRLAAVCQLTLRQQYGDINSTITPCSANGTAVKQAR